MTEAEWFLCAEPEPMMQFLRGQVGDRKFRMFAVACGGRAFHRQGNGGTLAVVEAMERFADRSTPTGGWAFAPTARVGDAAHVVAAAACRFAEWAAVLSVKAEVRETSLSNVRSQEKSALAALLREIVGNPFRRMAADRAWLSWNDGAVRKMAQVLYDERTFDGMPLLADALEDAGCTDADVLTHCRGGGKHVRGCWVIDLLLEKT